MVDVNNDAQWNAHVKKVAREKNKRDIPNKGNLMEEQTDISKQEETSIKIPVEREKLKKTKGGIRK